MLENINIDFQVIPTGDPKILVIADVSSWGIIEDKPSIVEITPPTQEEPIVHYFEKSKNNIFNSSNLYLSPTNTCNDLPDGLYKIIVKGSPSTNCKERFYLKTDKTRLELYKLYTTLTPENMKEEKEKKRDIHETKLLIEAAEASAALGQNKKALQFLKKALKWLKDINNCKDCE